MNVGLALMLAAVAFIVVGLVVVGPPLFRRERGLLASRVAALVRTEPAREHEDWCRFAPAFVPEWAVTGPDQDRVHVYHPPVPCAGCPAEVWWSARDQRSQRGNLYCSPECRLLAGTPPSARVLPDCPRPDKEAFSNQADAEARFTALLLTDASFRVYPCHCGMWHGGRRKRRVDDGQRVRNIARIVTSGGDRS